MRLNVEIGDDVQEHNLEQNEVIIGCAESCDIQLAYEGISQQHLRLFQKNDNVYVTILSNDFPTNVNEKAIEAGKTFEFTSFFPIEIGGIYIYKLDDVEVSSKTSLDDATTIITPDFIPEEEKIANEIKSNFEKEKGVDRDKFKPDIYVPSGATTKESGEKVKRKISRGTTTRTIKTKANGASRKKRKVVERETSKISPKGAVILFSTLLAVGLLYYTKYYKPAAKQLAAKEEKAEVKNLREVNIAPGKEAILNKRKRIYLPFFDKLCLDEKSKDTCSAFFTDAKKSYYEGIYIQNTTAFFFLDSERAKEYTEKNYKILFDEDYKNIINEQYADRLNYNDFLANNKVSTLTEDEESYQQKKYLLFAIYHLLKTDLSSVFKKHNVESLEVVLFEPTDVDRVLDLKSYLYLTMDNYNLIQADEFYKLKISQYYRSHLMNGADEFMPLLGTSHLYEFDKSRLSESLKDSYLSNYAAFLEKIKCINELEKSVCNEIAKLYDLNPIDGAILNEQDIVFVVNLDQLDLIHQERKSKNVQRSEWKKYISAYKRFNDGTKIRSFVKQYVDYNLPENQYNVSLSVIPLFLTDLIKVTEQESYSKYNKLVIIGYKKDQEDRRVLKSLVSFDRTKLKSTDPISFKDNLDFFLRSRINTIKGYLQGNAEYFKGF